MNILFVLTSHSQLGNTGEKTGFWIEEFAAPYYTLHDAGINITIASPKGGMPPIDPKSDLQENQTEATKRFKTDKILQDILTSSKELSTITADEFDAVFYPGGHGPMWDLHNDKNSIALIEEFAKTNKPIAAVCHAPAALLLANGADGKPLVADKRVTGFTNEEEDAVQLTDVVPFLLENELKSKGGKYSKSTLWTSYVIEDGNLITGQNPASSEQAAKVLLQHLQA